MCAYITYDFKYHPFLTLEKKLVTPELVLPKYLLTAGLLVL